MEFGSSNFIFLTNAVEAIESELVYPIKSTRRFSMIPSVVISLQEQFMVLGLAHLLKKP